MGYGQMLWIWLLVAPIVAAALTANIGDPPRRDINDPMRR